MSYTFINCHESPEKLDKEALINFWLEQGALRSRAAAEERVDEAVIIVLDEEKKLIAVSTCFEFFDRQLNESFFQIRSFVHEKHRRLGLSGSMYFPIYEYFNELFKKGLVKEVKGIVSIVENPFVKPLTSKFRTGAEGDTSYLYGFSERGFPKRVAWFEGALLNV